MALNVWLREEDLPKNKNCASFADAYFECLDNFELDNTVREIVKLIDNARFISDTRLETKYGDIIRLDELSTGCKLYLNVYLNPDVLFDTIEAGGNVIAELLKLKKGNILLHFVPIIYGDVQIDIDAHYGQEIVHFESYQEFSNYFEKKVP